MKQQSLALVAAVGALVLGVAIIVVALILAGPFNEAGRRVVVQDVNDGKRLLVQATEQEAWSALVDMYRNRTVRWVGGIVERYANDLGFRFRPDTIVVTDVTAEGLQATLGYISQNLDYWLGGYAYASVRVVESYGG